jgi:hypothetical protein
MWHRWHTYSAQAMGGGLAVAMEEVLRMSEQDFSAGHKADVQLALIFTSGFGDQDETLRTALSLLRRKYTFVKHVIATVVSVDAIGLHCLMHLHVI